MTSCNYDIESQYTGAVCGIDEAGRGPWAGPVVAAAVILDPARIIDGINDSKKISKARHDELYHAITNSAHYATGIASVEEIDSLNILNATKLAMQRAYSALPITAAVALIDGNQSPTLPCTTQTIVKGDSKSLSIAAASIIAKRTRDALMSSLAHTYPFYGWETNAGYGTLRHKEGLTKYGICEHHRKSFAPIKKIIDNTCKMQD